MNILVTRPSPEGDELIKKLLSIGKFAYHLPLIHFSSGKNLSSLKKKLNLLSTGDFLFIKSQHAFKYAHHQLLNMGISWPKKLKYFSIGQKTSSKIFSLSGINSKHPPQGQENSENLLQLPELTYINGRRVLVLKGNNGRTLLEKNLQKRGAQVYCCECYNRQPLQYNGKEQCYRMLMLNIKTIIITTGEMLKQLYYLIPEYYRISWLIQCQLIVISPRLAKLAKKLGWKRKQIIISPSANNDVLTQIIKYHLNE